MGTILILDDEPARRQRWGTLLVDGGHIVLLASSIAEGLVAAGRQRPDLVIARVLVHGLDGIELVQHLRAAEACSRANILLAAPAYLESAARYMERALGDVQLICEPVEPQEIFSRVTSLLHTSPQAEHLPASPAERRECRRLLSAGLAERIAQLEAGLAPGGEAEVRLSALPPVSPPGEIVAGRDDLRDQEANFRLLFANHPHPMWVYDLTTLAFLEVNQAALKRYGYSRKEFLRMRITDIRPPEEVGRLMKDLAQGRPTLQKSGPWMHRTKGGEDLWVEISSHMLQFQGRQAVLVMAQDVTERLRAEEQVRENTFMAMAQAEISKSIAVAGPEYQPMLDTIVRRIAELMGDASILHLLSEDGEWLMPAAVYHVDPQIYEILSRLIEASPTRASEELTGIVIQTGHSLLVPEVNLEEIRARVRPEFWPAIERYHLESILITPIRTRDILLGTLLVLRSAPGRPFTFKDQLFLEDLSDRIAMAIENGRLYQQSLVLNAELEQRVAERTAQLENTNRELEAFTFSVSHDLRAPLRHVAGFIDLLQHTSGAALDDQGRHYLRVISEEAARMGRLIDDLLAFSRVGRVEMSRDSVNFNALITDIQQEMQPDLENRPVDWEIARLPEVSGDRTLLRMVWVNLISNALKYTRHRPRARIDIGCTTGEDENVYFIRDNGVGFDMNYVNKLFGVFQRLHSSDQFEGTGIGLANVQRIVHRHGGRVWAEGVVDGGATFYISLPSAAKGESDIV
ncbi:MAG: PAS domain S-box protein [Chloroflexi bacterium]|nr:PAS domain S-box protein [Chloroflexota bacterium]